MATIEMSANPIVQALKKPCEKFTKEDIKSYIKKNNIQHVNFMYAGGDGRLKTLNFVINNADYLDEILTCGERVDGSSLFSYIEASSSDLYVVPRYASAFMDPSLAKDLTADRYKEMFANMNKELGKMVQKDLRVYQVFSDGHVLVYAAKFEKGAVMELDVAFKVTNGKFSIMNFRVVDPNAQAPAENNAAKK